MGAKPSPRPQAHDKDPTYAIIVLPQSPSHHSSTSPMSDPSTQERIEALLRKSLLGEELINTQFHLFSGRSLPSGRVLKPRVLCANNLLLAKRSTFFLDCECRLFAKDERAFDGVAYGATVLSTDIQPSDSDPSLVDLTDDKDVPSHARIDEYGYGSDSDLDDCTDPVPPSSLKLKPRKKQTPSRSRSRSGDDEWVPSVVCWGMSLPTELSTMR